MARDQFGHVAHWRRVYDPVGLELYTYREFGDGSRVRGELTRIGGTPTSAPWVSYSGEVVGPEVQSEPTLRIHDSGLVILEAAHELYTATAKDPGTEAKVLREWLEVERGRVDRALESSPGALALRTLGG